MLDRNEYEVVGFEGMPPNVRCGVSREQLYKLPEDIRKKLLAGVCVNPALIRIVNVFAASNPHLNVEARAQMCSGTTYPVFDFNVYDSSGLRVGSFSYGNSSYHVTSREIKDSLSRGSYRRTSSADTALKLMSTIRANSIAEKFSDTVTQLSSTMDMDLRGANSEYVDATRNINSVLMPYIAANWGELSKVYVAAGGSTAIAANFHDIRNKMQTLRKIKDERYTNGVFVRIDNGVYIVGNPSTVEGEPFRASHTVYSSLDSVPDNIRLGIGLLKLWDTGVQPSSPFDPYEPKYYMEGVGYKLDDNNFYILLGRGYESE